MADPIVAPWGILFDWDGSKTDEFMHGEGEEVPDPDPYGGSPSSSGGGGQIPADPGGYLYQSDFPGVPDHWTSYDGSGDLYGHAATEKFNQYASDPVPEPWH